MMKPKEPCSVCDKIACRCDVPTGGVDEEPGYYGDPIDVSAADWRDIMSDPDYPDDDQAP